MPGEGPFWVVTVDLVGEKKLIQRAVGSVGVGVAAGEDK